jgi:hypothetical protein
LAFEVKTMAAAHTFAPASINSLLELFMNLALSGLAKSLSSSFTGRYKAPSKSGGVEALSSFQTVDRAELKGGSIIGCLLLCLSRKISISALFINM